MGLSSSAFNIPLDVIASGGAGVDILNKDIFFVAEASDLSPLPTDTEVVLNGNSGLVRLWFAIDTADYEITGTKIGAGSFTDGFKFNADNNFVLKRLGYYRFDIEVKPGDNLNFKSSQAIGVNEIHQFRLQQIQIGA